MSWDAMFTFPTSVLSSSREMDVLSITEAPILTQSAFFKYADNRHPTWPDTVFVGPYIRDEAVFEPGVASLKDPLWEYPDSVHLVSQLNATVWVAAGSYWRKVLNGQKDFGYAVYKTHLEGVVLGKWKYYMINPKAKRRSKALIPLDVVVVGVTDILEIAPCPVTSR